MLENKYIVVTGANRGIGKAITKCFIEKNANVYALVRDVKKLENLKNELKDNDKKRLIPVQCDLSNEESVKNAAKEIISYKNPIDTIVNNAGVSFPNSVFNMTSMQQVKDAFQVNFFSPLYLTQILSKYMLRNSNSGKSIIFVSSTAAFDGGNNIEYTASKAAIIGAVRRLAIEYGAFGIRVNAIAPGFTDTDMASGQSEELFKIAMENNIIKRKANPKEIAETIAFLASENANYITGQVIKVSGNI